MNELTDTDPLADVVRLADDALYEQRRMHEDQRCTCGDDLDPELPDHGCVLMVEVERLREERDHAQRMWGSECRLHAACDQQWTRDRARADRYAESLAECYRLTGADPDGNDDRALARYAVEEVGRLRREADEDADRADRYADAIRKFAMYEDGHEPGEFVHDGNCIPERHRDGTCKGFQICAEEDCKQYWPCASEELIRVLDDDTEGDR